jgi:hypothetical protein
MKRLILKLCLLGVLAGVYAYAAEQPLTKCIPQCKPPYFCCAPNECCIL